MKKKDIYILLVFALSRLTDDALLARLTPERGLFATRSDVSK
jgi:hypothetical protein